VVLDKDSKMPEPTRHTLLAQIYDKYGWLLHECIGDYKKSDAAYKRAVAEAKQGDDKNIVAFSLRVHHRWASLKFHMGQLFDARDLLEKALAFAEACYGSNDFHTAAALINAANACTVTYDFAKSRVLFRRALKICQRIQCEDQLRDAIEDAQKAYKDYLRRKKTMPAAELSKVSRIDDPTTYLKRKKTTNEAVAETQQSTARGIKSTSSSAAAYRVADADEFDTDASMGLADHDHKPVPNPDDTGRIPSRSSSAAAAVKTTRCKARSGDDEATVDQQGGKEHKDEKKRAASSSSSATSSSPSGSGPPSREERVPGRQCDACGVLGHYKRLGSQVKLFACSRCHLAWYCSRDCQRQAWPGHKAACNESAELNFRFAFPMRPI